MGPQNVEEQLLTKERQRKRCSKCAQDKVPEVPHKTLNFLSAILTFRLSMGLEGRSSAKEMEDTTRA